MKYPLDTTPYPQDPRSRRLDPTISDGLYVYVQGVDGAILVLPDGPHQHPKVLGMNRPAIYAGDVTIEQGEIYDLTNLSGTFQFDDADGLRRVAMQLRSQGWVIRPGAARLFPLNGGRPIVLE
jgi:hypothetical protein